MTVEDERAVDSYAAKGIVCKYNVAPDLSGCT